MRHLKLFAALAALAALSGCIAVPYDGGAYPVGVGVGYCGGCGYGYHGGYYGYHGGYHGGYGGYHGGRHY